MSKTFTLTLLIAGIVVAGRPAGAASGACDRTTDVAAQACGYEAKDDYFITLGQCANLADSGARGACEAEAKLNLAEAQEDCGDQHEARGELCEVLGQAPYDPPVDPRRFLTPAQVAARPNPYLPLVPGSKRVYRNDEEVITVTVTKETREILGVEVMVVRDVVTDMDGELVEDTEDWFAQDVDGNVWYFGEIAQNFEDGLLIDVEGSWTAGINRAKPGIVMPAAPTIGQVYRQEFDLGNAEDAARVLGTNSNERTPAAACNSRCVVTLDFTPIEPDHLEHKHYAPGIGLILEVNPETGERTELISRR